MTLGKMYYLASVFDKINYLAELFIYVSLGILVVIAAIYLAYECKAEKEKKQLRKTFKNFSITFCLLTAVVIIVPSKEDFLFMSITKDYTPQQIYKMTKEEMKSSIDYLIKQVKEIK